MTKIELIAALAEFPDDIEVCTSSSGVYQGRCACPWEIETAQLAMREDGTEFVVIGCGD